MAGYENFVRVVLTVMAAYAAIGLIFGLVFISAGLARIDSQAKGAGWGFRLLILPGVAAFWPLLLRRWMNASGDKASDPPIAPNPHTDPARSAGRGAQA